VERSLRRGAIGGLSSRLLARRPGAGDGERERCPRGRPPAAAAELDAFRRFSLLAERNLPTKRLRESPRPLLWWRGLCVGAGVAGGGEGGGMSAAKRVRWYSFLLAGTCAGGGDGDGEGLPRRYSPESSHRCKNGWRSSSWKPNMHTFQ